MYCPGPRCHGRFGAARRAQALENASKVYTIIVTNDIQGHFQKNMDDAIYQSIDLSIWARHPFQGVRGYNQEQQLVYADFSWDFHELFIRTQFWFVVNACDATFWERSSWSSSYTSIDGYEFHAPARSPLYMYMYGYVVILQYMIH